MSQDPVAKPWPLRSGCTIDLARQQVRLGERVVGLTAKEVSLLQYLVEREGEDVGIEELHREVWGHGPEVISRAAQNTAHRLKRKIEEDPKKPNHLLTVHGVGFRLVRAREVQALPVAPVESTLFGRSAELSRVRALLEDHRVVTVSGLGGMGKTRFARELLREEGGVFADLVGVSDGDGVLRAMAGALGLVRRGDAVEQIGRSIAARGRFLLVLDNVEQLVLPVSEMLPRWREIAPDARWLITSRLRLSVTGEQLFALEALAVPRREADIDAIRTTPAVQLFLARAAGEVGDLSAVAELCRQLEGIPLALELAAARTVMLDAQGICDRLSERLRVLRRPGGGRHDAVAETLAWSWSLLTPAEQVALRQCAIFQTPFRVEAAEQVLQIPGDDFVLDTIQGLVDASLLNRVEASSPVRLRMYEVTRDFARDPEPDEALALRHARFFARHGAPERDLSERPVEAAADALRRDAELEDLIAGTQAALSAGDLACSLDIVRALVASMAVRGPLLGARPWVEAALSLADDEPGLAARRSALRLLWGSSLAKSSAWEEFTQVYAAALRDDPSPVERVQWHWLEAIRHLFQADFEKAQQSWISAMDGVGDNGPLRAQVLAVGAHLALRRRELVEARAMLFRSLDFAAGRDRLLRPVHGVLGTVLRALGEPDAALEHKEESLRLALETRQLDAQADSHEGLGSCLASLGRLDEAEHHFAEAAARYAEVGLNSFTLVTNRAELALERGDPAAARLLASEAAEEARRAGATTIEALILAVDGRAILDLGDDAQALAVLKRARSMLPEAERKGGAELDLSLAIAMARCGDSAARTVLARGRDVEETMADQLRGWCAHGEVEAALGDLNEARRALVEIEGLESLPRLDRLVDALRSRIDTV